MKQLLLKCPHCQTKLPESIIVQVEQSLKSEFEKQQAILEQELRLKITEKQGIIDFITNKITAATQSAASFSISQRASGEAQEVLIEEILKEFPDIVKPVPKGVKGADCLVTVRNESEQEVGHILIESKRTQTFVAGWLDKLKSDNLALPQPAELLILATKTMPRGCMSRFIVQDQVYICAPEDFKALYTILRFFIIKLQPFIQAQKQRNSHSETLFNYITSSAFRERIEGLYSSFITLRSLHFDEKHKLTVIHKKKEQELDRILRELLETTATIGTSAGVALPNLVIPHAPTENN